MISDVASSSRAKTGVVAMIALVFLAGTVVGGLAMSFHGHKAPFYTEVGKQQALQKLKTELNLTPEQADQLETILDDFVKYYRTVLSDGRARMYQILNEDQRKKFDQLLAKEKQR